MMQNYKFTIAYDGTRFFGWERQPDRDTIQGKLEAVLSRLAGQPVEIIGAGRTDAGVHARAMVANAQLDVKESPEEIRDYCNRYLPDAIAVREVKPCGPRFHARYNALGKTYRYTVFVGEVKPVFDRKYVTLLPYAPGCGADAAGCRLPDGRARFCRFLRQSPHEEIHRPHGGYHRHSAAEGSYHVYLPWQRLFAEHGAHSGGYAAGR